MKNKQSYAIIYYEELVVGQDFWINFGGFVNEPPNKTLSYVILGGIKMKGFRNMTPRIAMYCVGVELPIKVGFDFKKTLEVWEMENYFRIRQTVANELECPITAEDSQKCAAFTKLAATDGANQCIADAKAEEKSVKLIYSFPSFEACQIFKEDFDKVFSTK